MLAQHHDGADLVLPVSVKAVIDQGGQVVLVKNPRDEWELPGGKIEAGEDPIETLLRECREELGWRIEVGPILHAWIYTIEPNRPVLIVAFGCKFDADHRPAPSEAGIVVERFWTGDVAGLNMPQTYKDVIDMWMPRSGEPLLRFNYV